MTMDPRDELQSLRRGLDVLAAVNLKTAVTIADIARQFSLPRTTAQRILTTLQREGYIARHPATKRYTLTPQVRRLSDGLSSQAS